MWTHTLSSLSHSWPFIVFPHPTSYVHVWLVVCNWGRAIRRLCMSSHVARWGHVLRILSHTGDFEKNIRVIRWWGITTHCLKVLTEYMSHLIQTRVSTVSFCLSSKLEVPKWNHRFSLFFFRFFNLIKCSLMINFFLYLIPSSYFSSFWV